MVIMSYTRTISRRCYCWNDLFGLGTSDYAQILLKTVNMKDEFVIPPLSNLLFTRDAFSFIEQNVFIWNIAKPAR